MLLQRADRACVIVDARLLQPALQAALIITKTSSRADMRRDVPGRRARLGTCFGTPRIQHCIKFLIEEEFLFALLPGLTCWPANFIRMKLAAYFNIAN
jgi:hypothetical protein